MMTSAIALSYCAASSEQSQSRRSVDDERGNAVEQRREMGLRPLFALFAGVWELP